MANEKCIRDPVYNYIYLTDVEAQLIKSPVFQRLRFISQNGAAYYTYPSNRNCRFLHSLGCMKIGGDIFLSAVQDIHNSDVRSYLNEAFDIIRKICRDRLNKRIRSVIGSYYRRKDKTLIKYGLNLCVDAKEPRNENDISYNTKIEFSKAVLFQSVRLACLLHDIGHFPYSHALERAFGQYIDFMDSNTDEISIFQNYIENSRKEIHENIGLKILEDIIPVGDEDGFHCLCRSIARIILEQKDNEYGIIFKPLHGIVSGELDADRLDYSLRDPRASALEFGAFDIERLIENFALYKNNNNYIIVAKVQALSSIENFFYQRFMSYKYLIFHHNKLRMDEIVKEITYELLKIYFEDTSKNNELYNLLVNFHFSFLWEKCNSPEYFYCNENWFFTIMQNIYIMLESKNLKSYDKLKILISTFIFREVENVYSFFKRYNQYLNFIKLIEEEIVEKCTKLVEKVKHHEIAGVILELMKSKWFEKKQKEIYNKYEVICLIANTRPKVLSSDLDLLEIKDNGQERLISIKELSPCLRALDAAVNEEQQFNIFLIGKQIKKDSNLIDIIKKEVASLIVQYYIYINNLPANDPKGGVASLASDDPVNSVDYVNKMPPNVSESDVKEVDNMPQNNPASIVHEVMDLHD